MVLILLHTLIVCRAPMASNCIAHECHSPSVIENVVQQQQQQRQQQKQQVVGGGGVQGVLRWRERRKKPALGAAVVLIVAAGSGTAGAQQAGGAAAGAAGHLPRCIHCRSQLPGCDRRLKSAPPPPAHPECSNYAPCTVHQQTEGEPKATNTEIFDVLTARDRL